MNWKSFRPGFIERDPRGWSWFLSVYPKISPPAEFSPATSLVQSVCETFGGDTVVRVLPSGYWWLISTLMFHWKQMMQCLWPGQCGDRDNRGQSEAQCRDSWHLLGGDGAPHQWAGVQPFFKDIHSVEVLLGQWGNPRIVGAVSDLSTIYFPLQLTQRYGYFFDIWILP